MPDTLWCMHVPGPDEVYARASREDAEQAAEKHNAAVRGFLEAASLQVDDLPNLMAVVIPWPWSAERHAENLRRNIERECKGNA